MTTSAKEYRRYCANMGAAVDRSIAFAILYHRAAGLRQMVTAGLRPEMIGDPVVVALYEEALTLFSEDPEAVDFDVLAPRLRQREDIDAKEIDELALAAKHEDVAKAVLPYVAAKQAIDRHPYAFAWSALYPIFDQLQARRMPWEKGVAELVEQGVHVLDELGRRKHEDRGIISDAEFEQAQSALVDPHRPGADLEAVPTGIWVLDHAVPGGFGAEEFWCIAAGSSVGKTALAASMIAAACVLGWPVHLWTAEISRARYLYRLACAWAKNLPYRDITRASRLRGAGNKLNIGDRERAREALEVVRSWPLRIFEPPTFSTIDVEREIQTAPADQRPRLVFLDQLDLMTHPKLGRQARDHAEIRETTKRLKQMSRRHRITVVLLHQFRRDVPRDEPPPITAFRDAAIENDLDVGLGLYEPKGTRARSYSDPEKALGCVVLKNRDGGERGSDLRLSYDRPRQFITDDDA